MCNKVLLHQTTLVIRGVNARKAPSVVTGTQWHYRHYCDCYYRLTFTLHFEVFCFPLYLVHCSLLHRRPVEYTVGIAFEENGIKIWHLLILSFSFFKIKNVIIEQTKRESDLQRRSHNYVCWVSKESLQARRGWTKVFKVMKGKDLHPRLLSPAKLSFRMEGQIKCFPDKVKSKEFIITKDYYMKC